MLQGDRLSFIALASFLTLSTPAHGAGSGGDGVTCDCKSGSASCTVGGEKITVNCGPKTPTQSGKLAPPHACSGSAFKCMKGVECIEIKGGYQFHMTNCGKGGKPATGAIKTAGCVEMDKKDWEKFKKVAQTKASFKVNGPGRSSGR